MTCNSKPFRLNYRCFDKVIKEVHLNKNVHCNFFWNRIVNKIDWSLGAILKQAETWLFFSFFWVRGGWYIWYICKCVVFFLFLDVIEYSHRKLDSKYIFSYSSNHFNSTNITKTALLITQQVSTTFTVCVDSRARKLFIK